MVTIKPHEMRVKMLDGLQARQNGTTKPKKKKDSHRKTATLAEVREMRTEIKDQKSEIEHLREQLAERDKRIATLEATLADLREHNALLKLQLNRTHAEA
jgi:hypothetical protein